MKQHYLLECLADLASMIPFVTRKLQLDRRNLVLDRMVTNDVLSSAEAEQLKKKPLGIKFKKLDENLGIAPYFRSVLTKKLIDWCKNHKDPSTGKNYDVYRDGLKIYTTIDPKMQLYAEEAVIKHMANMQKKFNSTVAKKCLERSAGYS